MSYVYKLISFIHSFIHLIYDVYATHIILRIKVLSCLRNDAINDVIDVEDGDWDDVIYDDDDDITGDVISVYNTGGVVSY